MMGRAPRVVGLFMLLILLAGLLVYRMLLPTLPVPEIRPPALTLPRLAIAEELERVRARGPPDPQRFGLLGGGLR